jgi:hypothetical protein
MHAKIKSPLGDGLFLHAQRDYSPFHPVLYPVLAVVGVTYVLHLIFQILNCFIYLCIHMFNLMNPFMTHGMC